VKIGWVVVAVVLLVLQGFGGEGSNRGAEERFGHQRNIAFC